MSTRTARPTGARRCDPALGSGLPGLQPDGTQRWPAGTECQLADLRGLWQLHEGVLAIGHAGDDGRPQYLALPGDWIGVEALVSAPLPQQAWVLADALIVPAARLPAHRSSDMLASAYAQARRQAREFVQLRSGSLADRVRHLLLLLGVSQGEDMSVELPPLRQLSALLDATPEAICRVLNGLRQMDILVPQPRRHMRVARSSLNDLVAPRGLSSGLASRRTLAAAT